MTVAAAEKLLETLFSDGERRFLLSNPKFKGAVKRAPVDCILDLSDFGQKLLFREGYLSLPPRPKQKRGQSR